MSNNTRSATEFTMMGDIYKRLIPILQACLLCLLLAFSVIPHSFEKLIQHSKKDAVERVNVDGTYLSARSSISSEVETDIGFLLEEILLQNTPVVGFATDNVISPSIVPLALFRFTILANAP